MQITRRKEECGRQLLKLIGNGEDVSLRHMRGKNRSLTNRIERTFGSYRAIFPDLGLEYSEFARHTKHTPSYYLTQLIQAARQGESLYLQDLQARNPSLARQLNQHFGGYYAALEKAKSIMQQLGLHNAAARADPDKVKKEAHQRRKECTRARQHNALEQIVHLYHDFRYSPAQFDMEPPDPIPAKELFQRLKHSQEWLSSTKLAQRLHISPESIRRRLPIEHPKKVIIYHNGTQHRYLFHHTLQNADTHSHAGPLFMGVQWIAEQLGVPYSRIRSIVAHSGLGKMFSHPRKYRRFTIPEFEQIKKIIDQQ